MSKKILIITGGPVKKLDAFIAPSRELGMDVTLASFYDLNFRAESEGGVVFRIKDEDLANFDLVYLRVVGKRLESATALVNYLVERGIRVVDRVYEKSLFIPSTLSKSQEYIRLVKNGISTPKSLFGSLYYLRDFGEKYLGFPFVIKSTSGKKGRDVWLPRDKSELGELIVKLRVREKTGENFFAQEFIRASQRVRVLVIGERAIAGVTRPAKWRKRFAEKVDGIFPEGKKEAVYPVPDKFADLGVLAAKAGELDISGIDILEEDETGKLFVIEANSAPSWNLIKKDVGVEVEKEILIYLNSL